MTRLDAHQHFWELARGDYGWLTPDLAPIYRDFLPRDLEPLLARAGIEATILVQAAPTVAETEFMLSLAERTGFVRGVVGWVDFAAPDAPETIARLAENPLLVGLRPMIHDIADEAWMVGAGLTPAFEALIAADLAFDALVRPPHLPYLRRLLDRHPDLRVVIDHAAKPLIADRIVEPWTRDMAALADGTEVCCKLSGMVTEAEEDWTADSLKPYVDGVLGMFGTRRVIWGSDWPVCTLASSYDRWVDVTARLLNGLTEPERDAVMGGNGSRFYRLPDA